MQISMPFEACLLKNQAYPMGDTKLGHTKQCRKAMDDIFWLVKEQGGFVWRGGRLKITLTAYVANLSIDAQNLVDAVSDALEVALGVNDKHFDISTIRKVDREKPRIEIQVEQTEHKGENDG